MVGVCWGARREHPETTIVTDSVTSNGLTDFISGLGGRHFRFKRGYKNVINKGIELGQQGVDCQLMMETRHAPCSPPPGTPPPPGLALPKLDSLQSASLRTKTL